MRSTDCVLGEGQIQEGPTVCLWNGLGLCKPTDPGNLVGREGAEGSLHCSQPRGRRHTSGERGLGQMKTFPLELNTV